MKVITIISVCTLLLFACGGRPKGIELSKAHADSIRQRKSIDSIMAAASRPEEEEPTPDFDQTMAITLKEYDKIERIDTTIVDGNNRLHVKTEYYCLHDSAITVPKNYMSAWGREHEKAFITYNPLVVKQKKYRLYKVAAVAAVQKFMLPRQW